MTTQKILVPDMGDFKDVEVIEVLVKKGQVIVIPMPLEKILAYYDY